jgi:AcrR family transcriptional regulator
MTKVIDGDRGVPPAAEPVQTGRQKLMAAAMTLAATTRSLASLGLREVARQAGLNPNTFYRHFRDFDDLGLAVIEELSGQLRRGLRERRREPFGDAALIAAIEDPRELSERIGEIVSASVALVLEFVTQHEQAYVVGIRELHGPSPVLRMAIRKIFDTLAADMAEDMLQLTPPHIVNEETMYEIASVIIREMAYFSLDYLEQPAQRPAIRGRAERFILMMLRGAMEMQLDAAKAGAAKKK